MTICETCGADRDVVRDALKSESLEDRAQAVLILEGCDDCRKAIEHGQ